MTGKRRTKTLVQRCLSDWLGVDEVPVVVRIWTPPEPCRPKRHQRRRKLKRGFRDLPLFQKRRRWTEPIRARVLRPIAPPIELPAVVPLISPTPKDVPKPPIKRSLHPEKVTLAEKANWSRLRRGWDQDRPKFRCDCINGPRPCPWVSCRHHLYLDVKDCGAIKLNFPDIAPEDMDQLMDTCSLDVADRDDDPDRVGQEPKLLPLEIVGRKLGLTLERARQLEAQALQEVHMRDMRNNSGCA